ncbi:MAG: PEP-CTERM sorting domain-containing protein [bacterium]|nr:PEP-CTERM sorting domain-containing protein [bacterium]
MRFAFLAILTLLALPSTICDAGFDFQIVDTSGTISPGGNSGSFNIVASRNTTDELNIDGADFGLDFSSISGGLGNITVTNVSLPTGWQGPGVTFTNPQIISDGVDNRFEFSVLNFGGAPGLISLTEMNSSAVIGSFTFTTQNPFGPGDGFAIGLGANTGTDPNLTRLSNPLTPTNAPGFGGAPPVSFSAVPEPSSAIVLGLLGGALCLRRRKS